MYVSSHTFIKNIIEYTHFSIVFNSRSGSRVIRDLPSLGLRYSTSDSVKQQENWKMNKERKKWGLFIKKVMNLKRCLKVNWNFWDSKRGDNTVEQERFLGNVCQGSMSLDSLSLWKYLTFFFSFWWWRGVYSTRGKFVWQHIPRMVWLDFILPYKIYMLRFNFAGLINLVFWFPRPCIPQMK
jgi:hypothetical protein